MNCNICQEQIETALYIGKSEQALTSLCELRNGKVEVWLCSACGHMFGKALSNTEEYYESEYRIMLNEDDEDQIYDVINGHIVYRTDHQIDTLLKKLELPKGARLLDYGCAKAITPRKLISIRPDLHAHLFDVSSMYIKYWQRFLSENSWAIHKTPDDWTSSFEIITSFFSLEHIPDPIDTLLKIADLLGKDGVFYGIVPDTFGNVADFVVIDHVNHFTQCSLHKLLVLAGFNDICIDPNAHRGALVFTARKALPLSAPPNLEKSLMASQQLASYWFEIGKSILIAEAKNDELPAAIYGAGFYGAFISTLLAKPENVQFFLDANPFQQGKTLFGRPVLEPSKLPKHIRLLYIGLNPLIARATVANMDWVRDRDLTIIFLDAK
jgi:hypothetical protein